MHTTDNNRTQLCTIDFPEFEGGIFVSSKGKRIPGQYV
ncbi:hypothetical protein M089_1335 [Bacteroides ovatus str. 3725 D9 iii]|nr:hypothetical protein M088_2686 [Bacteroides ovatus str. 3725 D1 iv]KDS19402.1 hypothetical protein M082_3139 [Bacteroides fragilis str. 3725 D9 ii]KDS44618.1 hypothetical protein M089_1335 [Bacteroides ovatus str. 3725 D9 iii]CAG9914616.1 hypothetical protein BOVA208_195 [Bacteroides ovatus]